MIKVLCLMKSKDSYIRIKQGSHDVDFEQYIDSLEMLQERIVFSEYDVAIIDEKLWWKEEAESLIKKRGIELIAFSGNFEDVLKELEDYIIPDVEEDINPDSVEIKNSAEKQNVKYIIKEVPVEVIKKEVVYKSRDIKQEIMAVYSLDDYNMRDSFSCNMAALINRNENKRVLLIDMTNNNNLINHFEISTYNKSEAFKIESFNANTILDCVNKISDYENLHLLRIDNKILTKKNVKSILFAARDYDNIIFTIDSNFDNLPTNFVLTISHKLFVITDPLLISAKNNFDIINLLLKNGQVKENFKIVLSGIDPLDSDSISFLYKDYKYCILNRNIHLKYLNDRKLIDNKKELNGYLNILDLTKSKKGFFKKG